MLKRRAFISTSMKAAGAAALLPLSLKINAQNSSNAKEYTVQEVIDIILKEIPGAPLKQTVDTIKAGSADQKVTGIVTTMFATVDVIEKAAKQNANFIIAHEPTFYNHTDDKNWVPDNSVVQQKEDLLKKHGIAVWRFHDQWHMHKPDGISYGVLKKAGWLPYLKANERTVTIPASSLKDIAMHLKKSLRIEQVRVIGNLSQSCEKICLIPGAAGGQMQMSFVEKEKPDVLIVGEVHEWETAEYIRDAQLFGSKTSLIVLGHAVSEEPGMEYLVEWLQPKVPGVTITHIASGNPFTFV
jgi:putative NIF3 family GTP cyclohydrolase 1 type 2